MKIVNVFSAMALVLIGAMSVQAQNGDLKIRFEYGGDAVAPGPLNVNKDVEFCGKTKLVNEKLLVNPDNKGIQNVVVYLYTGRGGSDLPKGIEKSDKTHTLANDKCRFDPHIVLAQVGDTLKVTNPDEVGHNANIAFWETPVNFTIPAGGFKTVELKDPEPAPTPVACNIHPWMNAFVVVLDHPYAAISDENGELTIKGLPAGEELVFRAFHEAGSISDVTVGGKETEWKRSRFEVDIKPGMNDLGTVVLPADSLKAD